MKHAPAFHPRVARLALAVALAGAIACGDDSDDPPGGIVEPPASQDRYPPQPVDDLALAWDNAGAVVFAWTAPRDDIARDRVDRYDIRYGYSFPFDWNRSTPADSPPVPLVQGSAQTWVLGAPARGRDLFAAIRTLDAAGNLSEIGGIAHVRVPGYTLELNCHDAFSRAPVPGLDVLAAARFTYGGATDDNGRFTLVDLAGGAMGLRLTRGAAAAPYHRLDDAFQVGGDLARAYTMIPWQATQSALFPGVLALMREAMVAPGSSEVVRNWKQLPIPWYAPAFVNTAGLDYRAMMQEAADRWNERTGLDLFVAVDAPPQSGVVIQFPPRSVMGIQNGITEYSNDAEGFPLLDRIRIVDDFSDGEKLHTIMLHELGHTVRLGHLPAGFIMFGGQPLPPDITDDEVAVVRLLTALPGGTDLALYDNAPPAP